MIKVFTTNKNGKIELTKDELKKLLDEAYWEGYKDNTTTYTYHTPSWQPYCWTTTGVANNLSSVSNLSVDSQTITLNSNVDSNTITKNTEIEGV